MTVASSSVEQYPNASSAPVLVTQRSDQIWVAKLLTWAGFVVEGHSREDALQKLDEQVKEQLADGEIAYLNLSLSEAKNPWLTIAGKYQDDPNWDEYQAAIVSARQTANAIEGIWLDGDVTE